MLGRLTELDQIYTVPSIMSASLPLEDRGMEFYRRLENLKRWTEMVSDFNRKFFEEVMIGDKEKFVIPDDHPYADMFMSSLMIESETGLSPMWGTPTTQCRAIEIKDTLNAKRIFPIPHYGSVMLLGFELVIEMYLLIGEEARSKDYLVLAELASLIDKGLNRYHGDPDARERALELLNKLPDSFKVPGFFEWMTKPVPAIDYRKRLIYKF